VRREQSPPPQISHGAPRHHSPQQYLPLRLALLQCNPAHLPPPVQTGGAVVEGEAVQRGMGGIGEQPGGHQCPQCILQDQPTFSGRPTSHGNAREDATERWTRGVGAARERATQVGVANGAPSLHGLAQETQDDVARAR
jgi:hypothetical protein